MINTRTHVKLFIDFEKYTKNTNKYKTIQHSYLFLWEMVLPNKHDDPFYTYKIYILALAYVKGKNFDNKGLFVGWQPHMSLGSSKFDPSICHSFHLCRLLFQWCWIPLPTGGFSWSRLPRVG